MKKNSISESGIFTPRASVALALCISACFLALVAVGDIPALFDKARTASQKGFTAAENDADTRKSGVAASKKKIAPRGGAAKSVFGVASQQRALSSVTNKEAGIKEERNSLGQTVYTIPAARSDLSPPLHELAKISVPRAPEVQMPELELPSHRTLRSEKPDPVVQVAPAPRDVTRSARSARRAEPAAPAEVATVATGFNFEGIGEQGGIVFGGYPPDTNGSVGNDQYVEMVNSDYQVWSLNRATKTATSILGPVENRTLWAGFGGACQSQNAGDPIVLYDKVANRWFLSQFTSAAVGGLFYQCVAVSKTPDATGQYWRYAFAVPDGNGANGGDFGDYPHYGVWSDAYYVMAHNFDNAPGGFSFVAALFGAMDRTKMLAGDPSATWQVILDPLEGGHMPADMDGFAPPPGGAPGIFASLHGDGMYLYRMKVDFANAANTSRTLQAIMPIESASAACGGGACIPQPNNPTTLHSLADRLMFRLAYRNYIDHESLVVSHSVDPNVQGVVSGVRWYEFRISGQPDAVCSSLPCTYQQGTVADVPITGRSRWMPSIAQDSAENILVAYSATGQAEPIDAHSIRYTGRVKSDPLGTMTVPEAIIFTGTRNEVADNTAGALPGRWGDYTSTSIDPADDCTFWHANQYYAAGSGLTNFDWNTRIGSASFSASQCQPTTCTDRPTSAPTIGSVSVSGTNQIEVTWTGITPQPGSYAIERAIGAAGSEGLYQPLASVPGSATSFIDTTVQGAVTYSYRIIAATDAAGRCQALVRSAAASATATGGCNLKPIFAGVTSATSLDGPVCGVTLNWSPGSVSCPFRQLRYNIYRGTVPDFVPSASNRVASCVAGPSSYIDTNNLTSGQTYYYVVRAEDNGTGGTGACGGNEESNNVHVAGTPYGAGTQLTTGTWIDGGGDTTSFLRLNPAGTGNTADAAWRIVKTADDAGANHTAGGSYAYRNAGPGPNALYSSNVCASAETPVLTVGSTTLNLTYWERHQFEKGWDGVAIEYSRNGGAWTDMPAPSNSPVAGCMVTDVTLDYQVLGCTDNPPINACGYPATKMAITGPPTGPDPGCVVPTGDLTPYLRRCHQLTGLLPGDTIQFRWRFTSDPGLEFRGFYLDDIEVTNIRLRNVCTTALPVPVLTGVVSRKSHGSIVPPFDINMPLAGTPGIESRGTGSTNNDYTLVFTFPNDLVSVAGATVSNHNPSNGAGSVGSSSMGPNPNQYTVNLIGVSTGQYLTITLNGVLDQTGATGNVVSPQIGILVGDVNVVNGVTGADVNDTKTQVGLELSQSNFRKDINASGFVSGSDVNLNKVQVGSTLP